MPKPPFLSLYLAAAGTSQVPVAYHKICAVSLLSATLADKVWFHKVRVDNGGTKPPPAKYAKLYPNLYSLLIGPSAGGKDAAVDFATLFDRNIPSGMWSGSLTGAGLIDTLVRKSNGTGERPAIYLVAPELAASTGDKRIAGPLIKRLTALYGTSKRKWNEAIRSVMSENEEDVETEPPIINTCFGSVIEWLLEVLTPNDVQGGFIGRCLVTVQQGYTKARQRHPLVPSNYKTLHKQIAERLHQASELRGEFILSPKADRIAERWFYHRPEPTDARLWPSWMRQDDMIYKVAMGLSAGSGRGDKIIRAEEYVLARTFVGDSFNSLPALLRTASLTTLTSGLRTVEDILRKAGTITHSAALKKVNHYGIHADEFKKHIQALYERGDLKCERDKNGGRVYEWNN